MIGIGILAVIKAANFTEYGSTRRTQLTSPRQLPSERNFIQYAWLRMPEVGPAMLTGLILVPIAIAAMLVFAAGIWERFDPIGLTLLIWWVIAMVVVIRQSQRSDNKWYSLAGIVAFGLILRGWSVVLTQEVALGADPMNYTNLARAVMNGQGLITDDWRYGEDLRAYFPPFYPLVLAAFWTVFGSSAFATLAMNSIIDFTAAWALADVGRRLGSTASGRLAAIAYLSWPAFCLAAGIPQKESLTLLLVMLMLRSTAIWLKDNPDGRRRLRHGLWLGLWWGMLALTQPSLALAPAAVALALWTQAGFLPVLRLGLLSLPAFLLVLAPWWIRNWILLDSFIAFTTASGMMLNAALNDLRAPFPAGLFDLPEQERNSIMGQAARKIIMANPLAALEQMLRNLAYGFAFEEASLARFRHTSPPISGDDHARLAPVLQGSYTALLAATIAALWRGLRAGVTNAVTLYACALLLSILVINPWFEFGERHRLVLTPFFMVIAAGLFLPASRGNLRQS